MSIGNPALAEVLATHGSPQQMLAALAESGVLVAVRPDRSVVLGTTKTGERVLLGYTGTQSYARHGGRHSLSLCDAETILDIQRVTAVREIVVDAAGPAAAAVPIEDLHRYLVRYRALTPVRGTPPQAYATGPMTVVSPASPRGGPGSAGASAQNAPAAPAWIPSPRPHMSGPQPRIDHGYQRSRHPLIPDLRAAIGRLLAEFPLIHHVWISEVRTPSGAPGLMLHVKVHSASGSLGEEISRELHHSVRARLPQLAASEAPILMARVVDSHTERRMVEIGAHVVCADVRD
ncbi:SseB family protein [Rhizohabitans arisaemae]|uniref:SseB family protein n=1 Tax=Rhizohabitans arisaemae TaxID=2720610 RepID=UPI0024B0CF80|nr:SseB family protein [Rhizohabitans arisaemae]